MLKRQRTVPQVCLGPGGNLIGRVSCQIVNCEKKEGECQGCVYVSCVCVGGEVTVKNLFGFTHRTFQQFVNSFSIFLL